MFDKKQKGCVKRIHSVTDDGLYDKKAFCTVKVVAYSSSLILKSYQWWSASRLSCNFCFRCEVKCKYLLIDTCSKIILANFIGGTPMSPNCQGVKALYQKLEERSDKKVPSADLVDMAEFLLKNNSFEPVLQ